MEYTITFTTEQLNALIGALNEAPLPRRVTDPIMMHLDNAIQEHERTKSNGEKKIEKIPSKN